MHLQSRLLQEQGGPEIWMQPWCLHCYHSNFGPIFGQRNGAQKPSYGLHDRGEEDTEQDANGGI